MTTMDGFIIGIIVYIFSFIAGYVYGRLDGIQQSHNVKKDDQ